jgi:hypothetical protein
MRQGFIVSRECEKSSLVGYHFYYSFQFRLRTFSVFMAAKQPFEK